MNLTLCVAYFERMYSLYSVAWFTIILCYFFSPTKLVNCESKNWDLILLPRLIQSLEYLRP